MKLNLKAKISIVAVIAVCIVVGVILGVKHKSSKDSRKSRIVSMERVDIKDTVPASATITPLNMVEVVPTINGRIDKIMVQEGDSVRVGQLLAKMSSTNRAALMDAAVSKGPEEIKEIEQMYPQTPISSPVSGAIVAVNVVEGQTISSVSAFVISDKLIVKAQVDETDIGKIKVGTPAEVRVDAFSDTVFTAKVKTIAYQSEVVNDINIYYIKLFLDASQDLSRLKSGMSANVDFILDERKQVKALPTWAVSGESETKVELMDLQGKPITVELGKSNGDYVEVVSDIDETTQFRVKDFSFEKRKRKSSFMSRP